MNRLSKSGLFLPSSRIVHGSARSVVFSRGPAFGSALALCLAGVLTYRNALRTPFVWDDKLTIVTNQSIRTLWTWAVLSPPPNTPVAGRPLANLSFALNYALGGLDVAGYHALNLVIHLVAAALLFGIVRRTVRVHHGQEQASDLVSSFVALIAAAAWMVHPLVSEVVDYVTQRTESLMGLFCLATLYGAIRAAESQHAVGWARFAIAACACGMLTKESMVVAPVLVAMYDRTFLYPSVREAVRRRGVLYVGLAATCVIAAAMVSSAPRLRAASASGVTPWVYAVNQPQVLSRYVRLIFWPRSLVLDYGPPRPIPVSGIVPEATLVVGLVLATAIALVRWPRAGFLGAAFLLTLAPTTSFVPVPAEVGAERRMYLPLAAAAVLVVMVGYRSFIRLSPSRGSVLGCSLAAGAGAGHAAPGPTVATMGRNTFREIALLKFVVSDHGCLFRCKVAFQKESLCQCES